MKCPELEDSRCCVMNSGKSRSKVPCAMEIAKRSGLEKDGQVQKMPRTGMIAEKKRLKKGYSATK